VVVGSLLARLLRFVSVKTSLLVGYLGVTVLCGVLVAALALPAIAVVAYGTKQAATGLQTLPEPLAKPNLQGFTYVYDRNGKLLATFLAKNQVPVPLAQVAPVMRQAVVDIEDRRFYQHGAADAQGILRAAASNAAAGGTVAGGSTLTQQYVKNTLQAQATTRSQQAAATVQTRARKIQELRYAIGVEKSITKNQILEGYLNIATFGRNLYGVQASALYYFGVPASKLNLPQAAMIAGMTKSPTALDPTGPVEGLVDPRRDATARRNVVLDTMHQLGHISTVDWQAARRAPLGIVNGGKGNPPQHGCVSASAAWYCDYVEKLITRSDQFAAIGKTPDDRYRALTTGGLTIRTALDPGIQKLADAGIRSQARPGDNVVAATAIVKPGTGEVLAVANSKGFNQTATPPQGTTALNYAVGGEYGGTLGFQPGSGMKVFTAAAALADGKNLDYVIDSPYSLKTGNASFATCNSQIRQNYAVKNASRSENGPVSMNQALQESINTYFVQLEQQVGICAPWKLATSAGLSAWGNKKGSPYLSPIPLGQYQSFTLGTDEVSPLQMSSAYAMFAAGGIYCKPLVVTSITQNGRAIYQQGSDCTRLIPQGVADAVSWSLYHNVEGDQGYNGTARGLKINGIPFAAKTGTNNLANNGGSSAVWFNGYNQQFASSMAVGNATNPRDLNGQRLGGRMISDASGAKIAGAVWEAVMTSVLKAQTRHPGFAQPDAQYGGQGASSSLLNQAAQQPGTVPDVVGLPNDIATAALQAQGYTVLPGRQRYPDGGAPAGQVIRTYPAGGDPATPGSTVIVYESGGSGGTSGGNSGGGGGGGTTPTPPQPTLPGFP